MATRFSIAKPDIVRAIDELGKPILRLKDLAELLEVNRDFWRLARSTTRSQFVELLLSSTKLIRVRVNLPHRAETLYTWGKVDPHAVAASLKPGAYLSHFTAARLHGLTDQVLRTIYVNHEQRVLPVPAAALTQERVDAAFRRPQRVTSNIAELDGVRVCLVNGKHTGRLGVEAIRLSDGTMADVTDLERTLIDMTVRPAYAGGVGEVLEAFRRAAPRLSLNKLAATLAQIGFIYPYDQAVGFYLERAGAYPQHRIELFRKREFMLDFHLAHAMKRTEYSARWRLFFPAGL